jgi:heat shock protein HslJ
MPLVIAVLIVASSLPAADQIQPGPAGAMPAVAAMTCGGEGITVVIQRGVARVTVRGRSYEMPQVPAASGAKYEVQGDPATSFWSKGRTATLVLAGAALPECTMPPPAGQPQSQPPVLHGAPWTIDQVAGAATVDGSRTSIEFRPDGSVGGRASCNTFRGRYTLTAERLAIGPLTTTRMACTPPVMAQERTVLEILGDVRRYEIASDGALVLHAADARTLRARR